MPRPSGKSTQYLQRDILAVGQRETGKTRASRLSSLRQREPDMRSQNDEPRVGAPGREDSLSFFLFFFGIGGDQNAGPPGSHIAIKAHEGNEVVF